MKRKNPRCLRVVGKEKDNHTSQQQWAISSAYLPLQPCPNTFLSTGGEMSVFHENLLKKKILKRTEGLFPTHSDAEFLFLTVCAETAQ